MSRKMNHLMLASLMMAAAASENPMGLKDRGRYYETPRRRELTDRERSLYREHKTLTEFSIQGHKIMAYSKKDAITRLIHQGLISKKKRK